MVEGENKILPRTSPTETTDRQLDQAKIDSEQDFSLAFADAAREESWAKPQEKSSSLTYPEAPGKGVVEDLHGTKVEDKYRALEDDTADTTKWVEAEGKLTAKYLETIPVRDNIRDRMNELIDYEMRSVPEEHGGRYFLLSISGKQEHRVLYTSDSPDGQLKELIDPSKLSNDNSVSLSSYSMSNDGNLLAYSISKSGSDWQEWHIKDVKTGQDLQDKIEWSKFSGATWDKDNKGFFYSRYDEPKDALKDQNEFQKVYYHKVGTEQSADKLVYEDKTQNDLTFYPYVTEDGRYLTIHASKGTESKNQLYYIDLESKDQKPVKLLDKADAAYNFIGNVGDKFYLNTDLNAPKKRVVEIDLANPTKINELIPESQTTLQSAQIIGNKLVTSYMKDAHSEVKLYDLNGKFESDVHMPAVGTMSALSGKQGKDECYFAFSGYTMPNTIFKLDINSGNTKTFFQPKLNFKPDEYETKQIFYKSKDGTEVPMFVSHKKGMPLDGNNPTLLYGYGGFDNSLTPGFSSANITWMEMGGVHVVANLRGGGEYGEKWHTAGMRDKKQNVFDDFIAAAEYLQDNKYTSKEKLAINGGSNGGLLVAAALTQRPELFKAAIPEVGVLDMLRFHKFTIGNLWIPEYGDPDNANDFKFLQAYSPYHQLKPGTKYPATMIMTADHDNRVYPAHSFKFAAAMQAAQGSKEPVLLRVQTKGGHGGGSARTQQVQEIADKYGFLHKNLNMKPIPWKAKDKP